MAVAKATGPLREAWGAFRYEYRKHRRGGPAFLARTPIGDPIGNMMYGADQDILEDEPQIVLYRSASGRYFTQAMLERCNGKSDEELAAMRKAGEFVPGPGQVTHACEISEERAAQLLESLDAMELETNLSENDKTLQQALKQMLRERWA